MLAGSIFILLCFKYLAIATIEGEMRIEEIYNGKLIV